MKGTLSDDQHEYLITACEMAGGKNNDEVIFLEGAVRQRIGVGIPEEREMQLALLREGLVDFDPAITTGIFTITRAGKRYCERRAAQTDDEGNGSDGS